MVTGLAGTPVFRLPGRAYWEIIERDVTSLIAALNARELPGAANHLVTTPVPLLPSVPVDVTAVADAGNDDDPLLLQVFT